MFGNLPVRVYPVVDVRSGDVFSFQGVNADDALLHCVYTLGSDEQREEPIEWVEGASICGWYRVEFQEGVN